MCKLSALFLASIFTASPFGIGNPYRPAKAEEVNSVPTLTYNVSGQQLLVPNWSLTTFSNLPPVQESGQIQIPPDVVSQLGYNPSRTWKAGDTPDKFVMLGDVSDAFHLESFSLQDINKTTGTSPQNLSLDDFGLARLQTPTSLLKALPQLGNLNVSQVQPLQDLAAKTKAGYGYTDQTIADLVQQNPDFANAPLSQLDLKQYSLESIPGISQVPLQNFQNWEGTLIRQIPGLNKVTFSQFPSPIPTGLATIGITDIVWGKAETGSPEVGNDYFVSGKVKNDRNSPVACPAGKSCPYIELSDILGTNGPLYGKRWASGKYQKVQGGFGPLALVNGGVEPTGRLVYGTGFKVVLLDINESKGTADFGLYFRSCAHFFSLARAALLTLSVLFPGCRLRKKA